MRAAIVIAAKDLRLRLRDRSAIIVGIVAPLAIAALMSAAFRGADTFHFRLGIVDADNGPIATALVQSLHDPELARIVTIKVYPDTASAQHAVRDRAVGAALVIPQGFSASVLGPDPMSLTAVTSVNAVIAGNIAEAIASGFTAQINADRLSVATALAAGAPQSRLPALQAQAATQRIPYEVVDKAVGAHVITTISYYSPAMAIFFLLFIITYTARSYFADKDAGMVERMRAGGVRPVQIIAGKSLSVLVYGSVSLATIAVVTSAVFGAHWGYPPAAALVCLALVISVMCFTALVIGVSRTQRQAEGIGAAIVFTMAMLGGNFLFISQSPPLMRHLALATPNGWAMRAFTDLATGAGGMGTVVLPVVAILGISVLVGAAAMWLAPRAMEA